MSHSNCHTDTHRHTVSHPYCHTDTHTVSHPYCHTDTHRHSVIPLLSH